MQADAITGDGMANGILVQPMLAGRRFPRARCGELSAGKRSAGQGGGAWLRDGLVRHRRGACAGSVLVACLLGAACTPATLVPLSVTSRRLTLRVRIRSGDGVPIQNLEIPYALES